MLNRNDKKWWGDFNLEEGVQGLWKVGPLTLWIERLKNEWLLAYESHDDPLEDTLEINLPSQKETLLEKKDVLRFGSKKIESPIQLTPILADRPIVTKPEKPFSILPHDQINLYVSSPLWIRIEAGKKLLTEIPTYRPSDTWFGPNTLEGELCYATRTFCRLSLDAIVFRPHRAITKVTIHNRTSESFLLDSLNLPVGYLTLYSSQKSFLWTESVTMVREEAKKMTSVKLGSVAPDEAKPSEKVSEPRQKEGKNILARTFKNWF